MTVDRRRNGGRCAAELAVALSEQQVEICFQPQFSCSDGRLVGAEALARWNHPKLGRMGPDALFDMAVRSGRAADLTRHIAGRALAHAAAWEEGLRLSLNVTAMDIGEEDLVETMAAALSEAGFSADRLTLEITEQALVNDIDTSAARLETLAATGIRMALDDFGAGFCNFRYLKRLPLHYLKLDRSMVEGIVEDSRDLAVFRGILAMAAALDLSVIAEGVETDRQLQVVVREGCASWQGFHGAKPMAPEAFASFAAQRHH